MTTPAVSNSFVSMLRACTPDGAGALTFPSSPPITLYVRIGENGAWSTGTSSTGSYSIDATTLAALQAAVTVRGGVFQDAAGVWHDLHVAGGAVAIGPTDPPV